MKAIMSEKMKKILSLPNARELLMKCMKKVNVPINKTNKTNK